MAGILTGTTTPESTSELWPCVPPSLIARHPVRPRHAARLLHSDHVGNLHNCHVRDLLQLLRPGDVLAYNDCRVIHARLFAQRISCKQTSGRTFQIFLLEETGEKTWAALVKPRRHLETGDRLTCGSGVIATIQRLLPGQAEVSFSYPADWTFERVLETFGEIPIPPYLNRNVEVRDSKDYQTVFASVPGAVAAPTAGLHFSRALVAVLQKRGVLFCPLTLLVSGATFLPHRTDGLQPEELHCERFRIPKSSWEAIIAAHSEGRRIVSVGTTSLRAIETAARTSFDPDKWVETRLFITHGFSFRLANVLMTNFHTPDSSLIDIVKAFLGEQTAHALYRHAVKNRYRFYSYGDACWLEQPGNTAD